MAIIGHVPRFSRKILEQPIEPILFTIFSDTLNCGFTDRLSTRCKRPDDVGRYSRT
jgi:hypothetical protein